MHHGVKEAAFFVEVAKGYNKNIRRPAHGGKFARAPPADTIVARTNKSAGTCRTGRITLMEIRSLSRWPDRRSITLAALAGAGYVLLFYAGQLLVGENVGAYPLWLSDGFALGFWFATRGNCRWPQIVAVLLANFTISFDAAAPYYVDILGGVINAFQLGFAAWLTEAARAKLGGKWVGINRFATYVTAAVLVANGICSILMGWVFQAQGRGEFEENVVALFISDGLGILIVAPLILAWSRNIERPEWRMTRGRAVEMFATFLVIAFVSVAIFSMRPDAFGLVSPLSYLIMPFVLWAVARFQLRGATMAVAVSSTIAIYFTMHYLGPFVSGFVPTRQAVLELQGFLAVIAISTLFAGALVEDRRSAIYDAFAWRRRFEAAITASDTLVYEIRMPEGTASWAGDVEGVLGWSSADVDTLEKWNAHVHRDDLGQLAAIRDHLAGGSRETFKAEYRFYRPDGTEMLLGVSAYANANTDPELSGRGRGSVIGFVKDITTQKRTEAEHAQREAELRQAQKMEAIGRLAGGIAHDFNNILASILGYGEMARNRAAAKAAPDEALLRQLDTIMKAGERGRILISQILTFSRRNPEHAQSLNALDIVEEMVTLIRGSYAHEITFRREAVDEPMPVFGNATELYQLFLNLAVNGLQAMPDLGELSIDIGREILGAPRTVSQQQLPAGAYLRVSIKDHGVGIDATTRAHMFEPFFTTKSAGRGTGLGLSLAMSIAKAHGGGIEVASAPGEGATFTVYLPLIAADDRVIEVSNAAKILPRGRDARVLLVDDEPSLRDLAEEILTLLGYQTASFGDSVEALAAFERDPARFDAVLTDEVMPGLSGTQLAARIHALRPALPILIITGYGGPGFELRAQRAGVTTVLRKPYQMSELAHALDKALHRQSS